MTYKQYVIYKFFDGRIKYIKNINFNRHINDLLFELTQNRNDARVFDKYELKQFKKRFEDEYNKVYFKERIDKEYKKWL